MILTRNRLLSGLALIVALLAAAGCGGQSNAASGGDGSGGKLTLVAYSTPEEAYKELIPASTASGSISWNTEIPARTWGSRYAWGRRQ